MITYVLMLAFLLVYVGLIFGGVGYSPDKKDFFDVKETNVIKGLWSIIVVLVHTPVEYQNVIQDAIGSFAYIGVTFFFMASAYGLKYGVIHKKDYLKGFWYYRIPKLLIPALLCNLMGVVIKIIYVPDDLSWVSFLDINSWVKVLLLFYAVFWLIYYLSLKCTFLRGRQDILICFIIFAFSLIDKCTPLKLTLIWPEESLGFVYGIIFANVMDIYKEHANRRWNLKLIVLFVLSGIFGITYLKYKYVVFWGDYCLKIALGIILLLFMFQLLRRFTICNSFNIYLGKISYEIYLLHGIVFQFVVRLGFTDNSGVFILSSIILTIIGAMSVQKISNQILKKLY